jgi:glycosyltransferase involved in cell wall biosynthesis
MLGMKSVSGIVLINLIDEQQKNNISELINKNQGLFKEIIVVGETLPSELNNNKKIKFVRSCSESASCLLNKAVENCSSEYYIVLPSVLVSFDKKFLSEMSKVDNSKVGMIYCDYKIYDETNNTEKPCVLFDYNGDFTERFNFGVIEVYKKSVWEKLGGYDINCCTSVATNYKYKLMLRQKGYKFVHVSEPLYTVFYTKETSSLFSAFRYLQYSPIEEKEIENVFYEFLKLNNAFLEHKNYKIVYPKGQKFSPLLSIVSPTYNREKWVGKAIESVLENTFQDWELIFVDNASTDKTVDVIKKYSEKDKRIRLIQLPTYQESAISYCLNIGIKNARGKYYVQLDSDDEYSKYTLEEVADYMESHPDIALAVSYYDLIDENSNKITALGVVKHLEYNRNNILRVEGAGALRVWHIKVMKELGFFDEKNFGSYGEDYDLVLKTSELYNVGRIHSVLYHYRRHQEVTDVLRDPKTKVWNKTYARLLAFDRRKKINMLLEKYKTKDLNKIPKNKILKFYKNGG